MELGGAMMSVNGFAFLVMTTASALACSIAYWAGKQAAQISR
jgi:hypothetical protein